MAWKSAWKGAKVNELLPLPEKNRWWTWKSPCNSVEQEENHEKGLRGSWARNQMGNVKRRVSAMLIIISPLRLRSVQPAGGASKK